MTDKAIQHRTEVIHDTIVCGLLILVLTCCTLLVVGTIFNFLVWG